MPKQTPTTQTTTIADIESQLPRLIDEVARHETRVLIEESGVPIAALVSVDDLARLARLDDEREARERDFAVIDRMREAFKDVPLEEIERETAKAIAEVRAEMAAEREEAAASA